MTVRSNDGMDEFSTSSTNSVCILKNNVVSVNTIDPEFLGLHKSSLIDIQIKTKKDAIDSFVGVLNNTANKSMIETTALNAAAGLLVGNVVNSFEEGIELALNTIIEGKAMSLLEKFVADIGNIEKLKEITDG
jgi:anthranilate phosphoribosyltransferase